MVSSESVLVLQETAQIDFRFDIVCTCQLFQQDSEKLQPLGFLAPFYDGLCGEHPNHDRGGFPRPLYL